MTTVAASPGTTRSDPVLLPFRHTDWRSTTAGIVGAVVPPTAVTLWLAFTRGEPLPIVGLILAVVAAFALLLARVMTVRVVLASDGLVRWTLRASGKRVAREATARSVVVPLLSRDGMEVRNQLFLVDAAGGTLLRLDGRWWSDDQLAAVVRHMGVPHDTVSEPLTVAELRRLRLATLRFDEQHPALAALATAAVITGSALAAVTVVAASV